MSVVGGVLLCLVVSFLCDVVGAGGFSGNRVSSCSWWWGGWVFCGDCVVNYKINTNLKLWGGWVFCGDCVVGVMGVFGVVGVMDRGYAIKFSYGRTVMSVAVRFYRGGFAVNI